MRKFLLGKVVARRLSFLVLLLVTLTLLLWHSWASSWLAAIALGLFIWDWRLDVLERKK